MANFADLINKFESGTLTPAATDDAVTAVDGWTTAPASKYRWYDKFHDDDLSYISQKKEITVSTNQINLTTETHSQYVPFRIPRYYDGIDFMEMGILFHYVRMDDAEGYIIPINVQYNDEFIKFGVLMDSAVTALAGTVRFEIVVIGNLPYTDFTVSSYDRDSLQDTDGDKYLDYKWVSKPGSFVVSQSLSGNGDAIPDEDWLTEYYAKIQDVVKNVSDVAEQTLIIKDSMQKAEQARKEAVAAKASAEESASKAQTIVDNLDNKVNESIGKVLENPNSSLNLAINKGIVDVANTAADTLNYIEQKTNELENSYTEAIGNVQQAAVDAIDSINGVIESMSLYNTSENMNYLLEEDIEDNG